MPKVNVQLPDGRVVSVDQDEATHLQQAQSSDVASAGRAETNRIESSGVVNTLEAAGEGALDTVSFGGYGKLQELRADQLNTSGARDMEARAQAHPVARFAGEAAAMLAPTGWLGDGAKVVGEGSSAIASSIGELAGGVAGKTAGRIAEGAAYGLGGAVSQSNVTGDPLTVEGALEEAGVGGILNLGFGAAGDRLFSQSERAKATLKEIAATKADAELVASRSKLFEDSPAWDQVREAHAATQGELRAQNKAIQKENLDYAESLTPEYVDKTIKSYTAAKNDVLSRINGTEYGRQAGEAAAAQREAVAAYEKTQKTYDRFVNDTTKLPKTFKKFQSAIDDLADRYGIGAEEAANAERVPGDLTSQLSATNEALKSGVSMEEMEAGRAIEDDYLKNGQGPGGNDSAMAQTIKEYRDQLSKAAKLSGGGYSTEAGHWVANGAERDVDGAMQELHDLREKLSKYSFVEKPNLPELPVKPDEWSLPGATGNLDQVRQLSQVAVDLDKSIQTARQLSRERDHAGALNELRAVTSRTQAVPGMGDLKFPELPNPPRAPIPFDELKLPKTLREFAGMGKLDPTRIQKFAAGIQPTGPLADSVGKLINELGLTAGATPGATIMELNKSLQESLPAYERLTAKAAGKKGGGLVSWLKEAGKSAAINSAGYAAFGLAHGAIGAGLGAIGRAGAKAGLEGLGESAALRGSLIAAKAGIKQKVATVMAKLGKYSKGVEKLGPVTSYLATSFPSGEVDKEKDLRRQAYNRMADIAHAATTAPDVSYMALQPLLGHPGDVGGKLHDKIMAGTLHLQQTMPKDPGIDVTLHGSNYTPSFRDSVALGARLEAIQNPMAALERCITGKADPASSETLWAQWPAVMQEAASQLAQAAPTLDITYEQASALSQTFRVPLSGLQEPSVVVALQGLYLPKPSPQQGGASGGQSSSSSSAGGRPAAVNSSVAGSSVSGLIA